MNAPANELSAFLLEQYAAELSAYRAALDSFPEAEFNAAASATPQPGTPCTSPTGCA